MCGQIQSHIKQKTRSYAIPAFPLYKWVVQVGNTIPRCHQKFFHRDKTSQWLLKSILVFKEQWRTRFLFHTKTSEISQILNLISKFWTLALVPKDFISKLIVRSEHIYNTTYKPSPAFCWGGGERYNFQSKILKRERSEKNERLGGLKEFRSWIFAWEGEWGYFVSCKKRL